MRLLLPAPGFPPLFYEINISEEPPALAISGFDHGHRVVAQADVRPDGEFGLTSTQILGENAITVRAALSQTGGGLAAIEGTISEQPFKFVNTPSHKPQIFHAPTLSEPDAATLAHWQPVARGLRILAFALRSYESIDDPWSTSPSTRSTRGAGWASGCVAPPGRCAGGWRPPEPHREGTERDSKFHGGFGGCYNPRYR